MNQSDRCRAFPMFGTDTRNISIKKLKKDGSIDWSLVEEIADHIKSGKKVLIPLDSIYGIICLATTPTDELGSLADEKETNIVRIISSFKMIDDIAIISKLEFDFLHRIWPGELIVYLKDMDFPGRVIPVRIPKSKYIQDIITIVDKPLLFSHIYCREKNKKRLIYKKKEIYDLFRGKVDLIVTIDEFCKSHTLPTIIDISEGTLSIINKGRVSTDEIKSLYFLGKDDSAE